MMLVSHRIFPPPGRPINHKRENLANPEGILTYKGTRSLGRGNDHPSTPTHHHKKQQDFFATR
jgi:hypothetical protein